MLDLARKLPVFAAGKDQAGQVEDLAPGQLAGDRHDQVAGLNPDDGRGAGPADYSRGYSRRNGRQFAFLHATLGVS